MIHFLTIVLDGMPYLPWHLQVFNRLRVPWSWSIVEGVSSPVGCTSLCAKIPPRFSNDGTHEYLDSIRSHPNIRIYQRTLWPGKVAMCNEPLKRLKEPGLLWEVDADELWLPHQIETIHQAFKMKPEKNAAYFFCRYFLGPNIAIITRNCYGNPLDNAWRRVWRFAPGMKFKTHEPPQIDGMVDNPFGHHETEAMGCVFDHYAYATKEQVSFKEKFYKYKNATKQWEWLQANKNWPVRVGDYLEWVKDDAMADLVCK